jgi:hypothetical protein
MSTFGPAVVFGLCFGFMFGTGCSLAILYSIYLGGYRKGVEDSIAAVKPRRYQYALEKIHARRAREAATAITSAK